MNQRQLQQMAQQMQQMQRKMEKIQEELANETVEGSAGSYVSVTMNGHRELQSIKLAPEVGATPPPSAEELRLVREELDPEGVYTK